MTPRASDLQPKLLTRVSVVRESALAWYDRARFGAASAVERQALRLCRQSTRNRERGQSRAALAAAEQAALLYERVGQPRLQAFALNSAGLALSEHDLIGACRRYRRAVKLLEPHPHDQARVLANLARALERLGKTEQAAAARARAAQAGSAENGRGARLAGAEAERA